MTDVGTMYCDGVGTPQDYELAWFCLTKAATEDNSAAQRELGKMYLMGHGVPQDHRVAVEWFFKAAKQGDEQAQHELGLAPSNISRNNALFGPGKH
ncbi:hypothetical protein BGX24_004994 [Mortierella sp. AD032]|nr:hypothetical protein BGX24_004994 [Mortierella sp. AD032]